MVHQQTAHRSKTPQVSSESMNVTTFIKLHVPVKHMESFQKELNKNNRPGTWYGKDVLQQALITVNRKSQHA